jgi:hypothetical protein
MIDLMGISPQLAAITSNVLLILIIGWLTKKRFTFTGVITNGSLMLLAAGTILWAQYAIGYFLLVYGAFLIAAGMREEDLLEFRGRTETLGKILRVMGDYVVVAVLLEASALYCFWPGA